MFSKKRKATSVRSKINIDGQEIPVKIYYENRRNTRFSWTQTGAYLRMPLGIGQQEEKKAQQDFENWMHKVAKEKPEIIQRAKGRQYKDGSTLTVGKATYLIRIQEEDTKYHKARMNGQTIHITLSTKDKGHHLQKSLRHLISRCVGQDHLPKITERVNYWNDRHFNKTINNIRFKLNQTNWGSCSTKGNINFSTRLLFAPDNVIDYVIVHELAHLIEHNHSPAFWKLVSDVMPDYKEKEDWLKLNSAACQF